MLSAFRRGLAEIGFIEHQNVTFLYRYADGQYDRLPTLAELINPANKVVDVEVRVAKEAARTLGRELLLVGAITDTEIAPPLKRSAGNTSGA